MAKLEEPGRDGMSRRELLRAGTAGAVGLAATGGSVALVRPGPTDAQDRSIVSGGREHVHAMGMSGDVDTSLYDPSVHLESFDWGRTSQLPDGRTLREYDITAVDRSIEVAPGVHFDAWTYNGTVPGPTLRCTEGDRLRVNFTNAGSHPHTIHFHGIHPGNMDGVFEIVDPGGQLRLRIRRPSGRCPALPLPRGAPQTARPQGPLRRLYHRPQRPRARARPASW